MYIITTPLSFPFHIIMWVLDAFLLLLVVRLADKRWNLLSSRASNAIRDLSDPFVSSAVANINRLGLFSKAITTTSSSGWLIVLLVVILARLIVLGLILRTT